MCILMSIRNNLLIESNNGKWLKTELYYYGMISFFYYQVF